MNLALRTKLTLAIALLIVGIAGFLVIYMPAEKANVANKALKARGKSMTLALGSAVEPVYRDDSSKVDDALLSQLATRLGEDSDLAYIVVVRGSNKTTVAKYLAPGTAEKDVDIELRKELHIYQRGEYLHVGVPITAGTGASDDVVATLTTGLSARAVDAARSSGRVGAIFISAIILVIGVGIAWLVGGQLATPILSASKELDDVSKNLYAAARDQEAASAQEAAAVAETRRSMQTLLDSAQQIADRSSEVLGNAERSANGSREIAGRIGNLNELSEKVTDLLATIMQVADKADLLALNASLEGTRAGEAGKGFALVAAEMRRLAENVMESVTGIRELMKNMRDASQAAVSASEEGTRSSTATAASAREIALLTQGQRKATEQVIASMEEMGDILSHTLDGIQRTTTSAKQLTHVAGGLSHIVKPVPSSNGVGSSSGPSESSGSSESSDATDD